jgi:hypothetical protein
MKQESEELLLKGCRPRGRTPLAHRGEEASMEGGHLTRMKTSIERIKNSLTRLWRDVKQKWRTKRRHKDDELALELRSSNGRE